STQLGILSELSELITEFKRHQITPEHIEEQLNHTEANKALYNKLTDFYYIYKELQVSLSGQYIDGEDQLDLLIDAVARTDLLKDTHIYIDRFHRFTPQEIAIVGELLKVAKCVTVTVTATESALAEALDELDLFYQTKETYESLQKLAKEIGVSRDKTVYLDGNTYRKKPFVHLQAHFDDRPTKVFKGPI